jgi:hypothetical protein
MCGWFHKKEPALPAGLKQDRYAGKPLLILLDNYVLDCIGALSADKQTKIQIAVQRVYGGGNDWKATLRARLMLGDSLDDSLRQMWANNQQIARQTGRTLSPEEFAVMIVDQNFSQLLG